MHHLPWQVIHQPWSQRLNPGSFDEYVFYSPAVPGGRNCVGDDGRRYLCADEDLDKELTEEGVSDGSELGELDWL